MINLNRNFHLNARVKPINVISYEGILSYSHINNINY